MTVQVLDGNSALRDLASLLVGGEHAIARTMVGSDDGTTGRIVLTDASGRIATTVASSALPSGAATSAKQDDVLAALAALMTTASFEARVPALGQALKAASIPVALASDQGNATETTLASILTRLTGVDPAVSTDVNGVASNADFDTEILDSLGFSRLWIEIELDGTSSPGYDTIEVRGGLQNDEAKHERLAITAGDASVSAGVTFSTDHVVVAADASTRFIHIVIENPPKYFRVVGTKGAGGGGTTGARVYVRYERRPG